MTKHESPGKPFQVHIASAGQYDQRNHQRTMTKEELDKVLSAHKEWADGKGGQRADLRDADLRGADLQGADLRNAHLRNAHLQGAYLRNAHLQGADLRGADLQDAYLRDAYLRGADLRGADLRGAYLQCAYLRDADLRGADLRGADLQGAGLRGADLQGADLQGADLRGAYLQGAYLRNAVHAWAQVAFMGHGECGRMLTAVIYEEGQEVTYQCGCFYGSAEELLKYINDGEERLKASRMLAFETAAKLIAQ